MIFKNALWRYNNDDQNFKFHLIYDIYAQSGNKKKHWEVIMFAF